MPAVRPKSCCTPKVRKVNAQMSSALRKLNSTAAGRKAAQKMAKASHRKAVASRAAKAREVKAKKAKAARWAASPAGRAASAKAERARIAAMRLPTKQSGTSAVPKPKSPPPCKCGK
jgi:hypothetical protein